MKKKVEPKKRRSYVVRWAEGVAGYEGDAKLANVFIVEAIDEHMYPQRTEVARSETWLGIIHKMSDPAFFTTDGVRASAGGWLQRVDDRVKNAAVVQAALEDTARAVKEGGRRGKA